MTGRLDRGGSATPVVLLNGLGTDTALWDAYVPILATERPVLRIDLPGHGDAPTRPLPRGVADLTDDVVASLDEHEIAVAHVVGISLGGMVTQQMALDHPGRTASVTIVSATSRLGNPEFWAERAALVRERGMGAVAQALVTRWFTASTRKNRRPVVEQTLARLMRCEPEGYAECCLAIGRFDSTARLSTISASTLVIGGRDDPVSVPDDTESLCRAIPSARYELIEAASHLLTLEHPEQVSQLILRHLHNCDLGAT